MIQSTNPATGEAVETYEPTSEADVAQALSTATEAFRAWSATPISRRADAVGAIADGLRERKAEYATLMASEMGKPVAQGEGEVEKCAWVCEHYAEHGPAYLASEAINTDATRSFVAYRPLGPVLAVMPWNFPFWQVFRFAAPALVAGNVGLLKHAGNVPGCALAIEQVIHAAGVPRDAFRSLLIGSERVANVIASSHVKAVTLTGSTGAGRAVGAAAGKALKKSVLELGGSDPYVVLEDAELEGAAQACVTGRLVNSGQSCIAAKRWIVVEAVREAFEALVVEKMRAQALGDPFDPDTAVGPQARVSLRDELHAQVEKSVARGARVLLGGEVPDRPGAWYPPTILTDVAPEMPAYEEELFGPVASIIAVADEAEAIRVANDSAFGLGAAVFTGDVERGERIATESLDAGCCFVNTFVRSDPRVPFGGIKESGYGRELGAAGIREFTNAKTVWVA